MATAGVRAELECSVCLNTFTDPVNLTCGHTFCRVCIDRVLDTQDVPRGYSCPECREVFVKRPKLHRNFALRKILHNILSTDQKETIILCTYCVDSPVPAVKSCLLCEARLCEKHLNVHSKSPEHVLCDLTTSMESRKCSIHKKILEYYCTEDSTCICLMCRIDEAHQRHHVEILDEASGNRKKKLRNALERMLTMREETEERILSLQDHKRKSEEKSDGERERVIALFRELRRRLEGLEKRVLNEISRHAERVSLSVNDLIRQLEIKKDELSGKMRHIEKLCNMRDPLIVLQESDSGHLCNIFEGNYKQRCDKQLQGDLDSARVSHTLHKGLSTIMIEVAKMMPASTWFAMSSALPLEEVRGTLDDHTGDTFEELAGALSRAKVTSPQPQLHPNRETEAESCFNQPVKKVEEKESSSEESKEEDVFISVFQSRGVIKEEESEKVCFEEEDSPEVCFQGEESEEVWFGEEEPEEVCFGEDESQEFYFEEEESQEVWCGEESEEVCFEEEEDSPEVCFEELEEVCFGVEESEEVCFGEEQSEDVCFGEDDPEEVCFGEDDPEEVCFGEDEPEEVCFGEDEPEEVCYEEEESHEVWYGEEESQAVCFEEEEPQEVWFGEEESQEVSFEDE
ncbi:PREDICTED: tripartite motif-containing protein 26-like [Nanorana parkeri]|uniref:tripartite motif-containing protein 26-like n=1 Tax=Nanorana parkeri TaxID=125878 RepID=UPI0008547C76|nr:PREDICTED: tripartite motif-containing protein 26-like [Nanorana parkeri]